MLNTLRYTTIIVAGLCFMLLGCEDSPTTAANPTPASPIEQLPTMADALAHIRELGGKTTPEAPTNARQVKWVDLSETDATDVDLEMLRVFTELESIDLSNTQVTQDGLSVLAGLPRLSVIILHGLDIHECDLARLHGLTLKHVSPFPDRIVLLWLIPDNLLTPTEWATSADGAISLRLMALNAPGSTNGSMPLFAELRNNTDESINVLRPFGDAFMVDRTLTITGPKGPVVYGGPYPSYSLNETAFTTIPPGGITRDRKVLSVTSFPSSDMPGEYVIVYQYPAGNYYRTSAAESGIDLPDLWIGELTSKPITIEKR